MGYARLSGRFSAHLDKRAPYRAGCQQPLLAVTHPPSSNGEHLSTQTSTWPVLCRWQIAQLENRGLPLVCRPRSRRGRRSGRIRPCVGNRHLLSHRLSCSTLHPKQTPIQEGRTSCSNSWRKVGSEGGGEKVLRDGSGCRINGGTRDRLHR